MKIFYREHALASPKDSFKTHSGPEGVKPTMDFKKKHTTSSGRQGCYVLKT